MTMADDTRMETAERRALVVELRRKRLTFAEIGDRLGVSAQRAHRIYTEALAAVPALQVDQHRAEELTLVDDAIADLLAIARDHKQARTSVEAWNAVRGWAERKAKLLGLDVPTRLSIDAENIGREITELITALGRVDDGAQS